MSALLRRYSFDSVHILTISHTNSVFARHFVSKWRREDKLKSDLVSREEETVPVGKDNLVTQHVLCVNVTHRKVYTCSMNQVRR